MEEQNNQNFKIKNDDNQEVVVNEETITEEVSQKPKSKLPIIIGAAAAVVAIAVVLVFLLTANLRKYNKAFDLIKSGNYQEAYALLEKLGDYKDAKMHLARFHNVIVGGTVASWYDGEIIEEYTITYTYNNKNLPVKVVESSNWSLSIVEYSYDDKGNLTKEWTVDHNGDTFGNEYTYDSNGNQIQSVYTNSDGKKSITDYTYDSNGNRIQSVYTNCMGENDVYDTIYDDKGNIIKEVHTGIYGKDIYDYIYDSKGNLIKRVTTYSSGSKYITDYTYDDKNNEIKAVTSDSNGEKTVIYDTTYDEKGNKIKEVATYSDGSKQIYEYAYDDKGSVIMFSYTGSEGYIKKSEITYKFVYIPYDLSEEIFYIINPMTEY